MTSVLEWLTGPMAESLCVTLLHSLWQGVAWCMLLGLVLRRVRNDRPQVRYIVALMCLYGLLGSACLTWSILRQTVPANEAAQVVASSVGASEAAATQATPLEIFSSDRKPILSGGEERPSPAFSLAIGHVTPWVVAAWLLGASTCLLLSSRHVAAVRRFQPGTPIEDPEALRLLAKLLASLNLSQPIRLLSVEGLPVPGVTGVLRPAILIPSALVTGLTPDQWEAILAHELAHVRRWDYLANLLQLVIESLLFFNPAVWWLSRLVRLEREACCDAVAVGLTAQPLEYVTLLVDLAKRLQPGSAAAMAAAVSFSREPSSSLLERVRRIVTPGNRSELAVNRPVAISLLVLGLAAVALLQTGTDMAVAVAASILTEEQRLTELVETATEMGALAAHDEVTIRGTIIPEGGGLLHEPVVIAGATHLGDKIQFVHPITIAPADPMDFDVAVGPGITHLKFGHPDFAETFAGPFGGGDDPVVTGVKVVLQRGVEIPVTIVGKDGLPVHNARLTCASVQRGVGPRLREVPSTDENGRTVLKHINRESEYTVSVQARGFQPLSYQLKKGSTTPLRLEMLGAESASGTIVDEHGEPVPNALVRPYRSRRAGHARIPLCIPRSTPVSSPASTHASPVTDTGGHFVLEELADFTTYDVLVEAAGFGPMMMVDVHAGDRKLRGMVQRPLTVEGTIRGPMERLMELDGKRKVNWDLSFPCESDDPSHRLNICGGVECNVIDDVGYFALPPLGQGELLVRIGDDFVRRQLTTSLEDLEIVLSGDLPSSPPHPPAKRPIRVTFTWNGELVSPRGDLEIHSKSPEGQRVSQSLPIEDGVVEAEVVVPNQLRFGLGEMIGYCRGSRMDPTEIGADDESLEIVIPVQAAGAVKGLVVDSVGIPVLDARVKFRSDGNSMNATRTNEKGEFFVPAVPFGAECSFCVMEDRYIAIGPEFTMRAEAPLPFFRVQLGEEAEVTLRLVDPTGAPITGQAVELNSTHPRAKQRLRSDDLTNRHGECVFRGLNVDLAGHYAVTVSFTREYLPATFALDLADETMIYRVKRGCVIEGTLLDPGGKPVVGARLSARLPDWKLSDGTHRSYLAEAETDSHGRFRFSNLPPVRMQIRGNVPMPRDTFATPANADEAKSVTLRTRFALQQRGDSP
jgi:beta-lactamase regulating signal transducer with metallopeptidase domain